MTATMIFFSDLVGKNKVDRTRRSSTVDTNNSNDSLKDSRDEFEKYGFKGGKGIDI